MKAGDHVAERFVIERLAGRGGMGSVYRALDRVSDERVALKVLDGGPEVFEERFFREARALAAVQHPAVVRYIGQGAAGAALWIAMEWLDGEDLATRLGRGRLDARSALRLVARAADGVAEAHAAGVVHRDLKPSNLFLQGGDAEAVKVLDFGVAKLGSRTRAVTRTGQMVGTVGYMAPEQITGERDVGPAADVFSLGCVLFECLTSRPAFPGETLIAVIAKVLRDEPPRASEFELGIPAELDQLIASMLHKDPRQRPTGMAALGEKLRHIASGLAEGGPPSRRLRSTVSGREQRLVSAILLEPRGTFDEAAEEPVTGLDATTDSAALVPGELDAWVARVRAREQTAGEVAAMFEAESSDLGDGAFLFVLSSAGTAKDQAARAAGCALALRSRMGDVRIAIGTGLATPTGGRPIGPAIDRAARMLAEPGSEEREGDILLDDVTAGLLDDRFEVSGSTAPFVLEREHVARSGPPPGPHRIPFVGRDKEMAIVDAVLAECLEEPVARAVVVTGPPGAGKSRLRREFCDKAYDREGVRSIVVRSDVVGSGAALSLVRQIAERLLSLPESESRMERGARVSAYIDARWPAGADALHAREFLGELVGAALPGPPSAELVAARAEPRAFASWLRRCFTELVRHETERGPWILVLEDLHWGDDASVAFVGEASKAAAALPLFVLVLGRTEVWDALPQLRASLDPHEVKLGGLTQRAAQRLAEAALGGAARPEVVQRIVAHSEGNPFFLEELARSAADGRGETSETVLAVVQSRIQRLDSEARRLLRAGSVFGRVFKQRGVTRLLGVPEGAVHVEGLLRHLEDREIIEPVAATDPHADRAFAFRHDLLREAAYTTLPDADRARAHALAAEWLEQERDVEASVMAEHFERAGDAARAVEWLIKATEEAHNAGSYERAITLAERGLAAGATGVQRGTLRTWEGLAHGWRNDWAGAYPATSEALTLLPRGSTNWFRAAAVHTFACASTADSTSIAGLTGDVLRLTEEPPATGAYGFALFGMVLVLGIVGERKAAEELLARMDARGDAQLSDYAFVTWRSLARAHAALSLRGEPGAALEHLAVASRFAVGLADGVVQLLTDFYTTVALQDCGASADAEGRARALLATKRSDSVPYLRSWSHHTLAHALLGLGRVDEALGIARQLAASTDALFAQRARSLLAQALHAAGRDEEASASARQVLEGSPSPQDMAAASAVESRVALARGDAAGALAHARRGHELARDWGGAATTRSTIEVAWIQALQTSGDEGLPAALSLSIARLGAVARSIREPRIARAWVAFGSNQTLLAVARAHGIDIPPALGGDAARRMP